ncbi:helix-turn-helix transcriptional regulator [Luteipulveratus mongoliensis]|uniref:Transcriptional regulator n=1 Tax=Luteipulveratus mongoliensis TaxID=571913 RepID=A0A0K1JFQ8_9MICO|nr:YafY family protein [Luteipulveratus mongoliensis]AKU15544.1 transcriptional regulator [Luteipulveratus mongoliensis]
MSDTTARILQLLGLLQSRPVWTGPELAERLGVTTRSVRRDVERLRDLGYPVQASQGVGGGYQLGAGRALPPLLLDSEEAVAVAVCLRLAAGGTVAGVGEAAVRTMAKLDQVLPARLRAQVAAVQQSTITLEYNPVTVDPAALLALAHGIREEVRVTFGYEARGGERTERRIEPYRLAATGRRWYLMAFDLDREDWRTFRLDRMENVEVGTWRFKPRDAPDAEEYIRRSVTHGAYESTARLRMAVNAETMQKMVPRSVGTVTPVDDESCILEIGAEDLDMMASHLPRFGVDFVVLDPPELREALQRVADRISRIAATTA